LTDESNVIFNQKSKFFLFTTSFSFSANPKSVSMRAALTSARLGEKLARMKESKEVFDYNLLDFEHPDFRKVEQKCIPV